MTKLPDTATVAVLALLRRSTATVISAEMLAVLRDVRLAERALNGDCAAAVEWLQRHDPPVSLDR